MAALNNVVFDDGLSQLTSSTGLTENFHILSQSADDLIFGNLVILGSKDLSTTGVSAPGERSGGGREVTISAITDGSVSATDTATHYAITDDSGTLILASGSLSASQAVTSGNTFTTTEFTIGIPDPA